MKAQVSALMDDEYDADAAEHLLAALKSNDELVECWSTYHLIGDAMRGAPQYRSDFHTRMMQKLEAEPTVLAPQSRRRTLRHILINPSFLMSAAASVAAVAFVGWVALQQHAPSADADIGSATIAQNSVSPESVNSYLLAHQETFVGGGLQTADYTQPAAVGGDGN